MKSGCRNGDKRRLHKIQDTPARDRIAILWNEAQKAAQAGFLKLNENATSEILQFRLEAETANQNVNKSKHLLSETQAKLENTLKRVSEADYLLSVNADALVKQENAFKSLELERNSLNSSIIELKASFSQDLSVVSSSLSKAEDRYKGLEKKFLLELDQSRHQIIKLEKELRGMRTKSKNDQISLLKDLSKLQTVIAQLNQKVGNSTGAISKLKRQLRLLEGKLAAINKKHELYKSTHTGINQN